MALFTAVERTTCPLPKHFIKDYEMSDVSRDKQTIIPRDVINQDRDKEQRKEMQRKHADDYQLCSARCYPITSSLKLKEQLVKNLNS